MRWLVVWWFVLIPLFADGPFAFSETRYVYSIDKTLNFTGAITFDATRMEIDYETPERKRIVYTGERLQVFDAESVLQQDIDLSLQPGMKLYMQFMLWLYRGEFEALEGYFTLTQYDDELHLMPIAPTDKVVKSVKVRKEAGAIRFIKTSMSNQDEIAIDIAR